MSNTDQNLSPEDWEQLTRRGLPILLLVALGLVARTSSECQTVLAYIGVHTSWLPTFSFASIIWFWWVAVIALLWALQKRGLQVFRMSFTTISVHAGVAVLLAFCHLRIMQAFVTTTVPLWPEWGHAYLTRGCITGERFSHDLLTYGVLLAISLSIFHQLLTRRILLREIALEQQLTTAQLQALQTQVEPHFLFNALNAIQSLVDLKRCDQASEALKHLNVILRSSLQKTVPGKVKLIEELRVVQSYLAMQRIRFADRIEFRLDTGPDVLHSLVPNFILQPLVENAIHHGLSSKVDGGLIETFIHRRGTMLCLRISDNGAGNAGTTSKGLGISLQNTRKRLEHLYPDRFRFTAGQRVNGGFEVEVLIPFEGVPA